MTMDEINFPLSGDEVTDVLGVDGETLSAMLDTGLLVPSVAAPARFDEKLALPCIADLVRAMIAGILLSRGTADFALADRITDQLYDALALGAGRVPEEEDEIAAAALGETLPPELAQDAALIVGVRRAILSRCARLLAAPESTAEVLMRRVLVAVRGELRHLAGAPGGQGGWPPAWALAPFGMQSAGLRRT